MYAPGLGGPKRKARFINLSLYPKQKARPDQVGLCHAMGMRWVNSHTQSLLSKDNLRATIIPGTMVALIFRKKFQSIEQFSRRVPRSITGPSSKTPAASNSDRGGSPG
nr:hypothetical protein BDOA9_0143530 [Bradyrhizobium sp. DOA9]